MRIHLATECMFVDQVCEACELIVSPDNIPDHDCVKSLKANLQTKTAENEILIFKVNELEEKLSQTQKTS